MNIYNCLYLLNMIYNYNWELTAGYVLRKCFRFSTKRKKNYEEIQLRDKLFAFSNKFLIKIQSRLL